MKIIIFFMTIFLIMPTQKTYAAEIETEEMVEEKTVFTDEEFNTFLKNKEAKIKSNPDDLSPITELWSLVIYKGVNKEQLQTILEHGLLTDQIDYFKSMSLLDENYTLPDNVIPIGKELTIKTKVIEENNTFKEDKIKHDYEEINESAEANLIVSTCDDIEKNTYLNILSTATDKEITADTLTKCSLNLSYPAINFRNEDGVLLYEWIFPPTYIDPEDNSIDLGLEYDENKLHFNAQRTLFRPITIIIKMEKPNTEYTFRKDKETFGPFLSDNDGYVIFTDMQDATDYSVIHGSIKNTENETSPITLNHTISTNTIEKTSLVKMIIFIILLITGIGLFIYGIKKIKRR